MKFEQLKSYLLDKPETTMEFPFGPDVNVFKVKGKMFALIGWKDDKMNMNLKCDPDESVALRDIFFSIKPGYHMNKKHWITIYFDEEKYGPLPPEGEILRLIDNSFRLVVSKMPKSQQRSIRVHEG